MTYGKITIHLKPADPQQGEVSLCRPVEKPQWDAISEALKHPSGGDAMHWKANHDAQVSRARVLIERDDLPLERVRAYQYMLELDEESKRLHRELAAERLRADQGWQRYEAANRAKNDLKAEKANLAGGALATISGMADCMDMVRTELIEAGIVDESVPPMFIADTVIRVVHELKTEAARFAACRHQARHMQEDGGEKVFVMKVDQYIRDNKL